MERIDLTPREREIVYFLLSRAVDKASKEEFNELDNLRAKFGKEDQQ